MLGLLQLLLMGLVFYVGLSAWLLIDRLRHPPRRTYASAVARGKPGDPGELSPARSYRAMTFDVPGTGGRSLPAWDIEGDDASGPVMVCTPGWGDSKIGVLARLPGLAPGASRLVAWDPTGLGEAAGSCGLGTDADMRSLCALVDSLEVDPSRVILFGWSMGAGVSLHAAAVLAERGTPVRAVIAEAPYRLAHTPVMNYLRLSRLPSLAAKPLAMAWLGWRLRGSLDWSTFDRAGLAARVGCPLLVIHGTMDEICPVDDGRAIAAAAPSSLMIAVEGAGHNDLWSHEPHATQCARAAADFVAALDD